MYTRHHFGCRFALLGATLAVLLTSCANAPSSVAEFFYPQQPTTPYPAIMRQQATRLTTPQPDQSAMYLEQAMQAAQMHVLAGEARLREQQQAEALREFERARLLIEQQVDPALASVQQQATVQGGATTLATANLQILETARQDLLVRANRAYDLRGMATYQQDLDKLNTLRKQNQPILRPLAGGDFSQDTPGTASATGQHAQLRPLASVAPTKTGAATAEIDAAIARFQQHPEEIERSLRRANQYLPTVAPLLTAQGLPEAFAFVAFLESGCQPDAEAADGAAGLWQMPRALAEQYGLATTSPYDERLLIEPSTRAFAAYLVDHYRQSGSWELALSAYRRAQTANARWDAGSDSAYFARLQAAIKIAQNPRDYGFAVDLPNLRAIPFDGRQAHMDAPGEVKRIEPFFTPLD